MRKMNGEERKKRDRRRERERKKNDEKRERKYFSRNIVIKIVTYDFLNLIHLLLKLEAIKMKKKSKRERKVREKEK